MSKKIVLTFESVHDVMKTEKLLKKSNISVKMIPTPRDLSSDCGTSILVEIFNKKSVQELLNGNNLHYNVFEKKI